MVNGKVALDWVWRITSVVVVPILFWLGMSINNLNETIQSIDRRVVAIESNRFTSADGMAIWQALADKANKDDVPPTWFLADFDDLKSRVDALEGR